MYCVGGLSTDDGDLECKAAPRRILAWVLLIAETHEVFSNGHGTAPDFIYTRGVPDSPSQDPTSFDKKHCTIIIVES